MGLDMYAYVAAKPGAQDEYYEEVNANRTATEPRELAYWRKHPNLHGWMEQLWRSRNPDADEYSFNGIELELTWEDIERLENDIKTGVIAKMGTTGFFFGSPSDDYYYEKDLEFVRNAKAELFIGLKVFYNSSW